MTKFLKDYQGYIVIGLAVLWFLLNATFFDKSDFNIVKDAVAKQEERIKTVEIGYAAMAADVRNVRSDVKSIRTDFEWLRIQLNSVFYGKAK